MKADDWKKILATVLPIIAGVIVDMITDDKKKKK